MKRLSTLVTTAKNEAPYIWEWVAYHRMIGFDNIIMFQNDSNDGTDQMMKVLRDAGVIQYFYNRAEQGKHQIKAYWRASRQPEYTEADWAMALDMDEFLVIHTNDGTVNSLIDELPDDTDCALICWKRFGAGRQTKIAKGLVTDRFTLSEHDDWIVNRPIPFKSLFRRSRFTRPGIHQPLRPREDFDPRVYVNGSGLSEDEFTLKNYQCTDPQVRKLAQINHYITRDPQSFTLKSFKGSAHQANRGVDESYWKNRNKNQMEDRRVQRFRTTLIEEMQRIDDLTHGKMSLLTEMSIEIHRAAFRAAVHTPAMAHLYEFCRDNPQVPPRLQDQKQLKAASA